MIYLENADVVELVYTCVRGAHAARLGGSNPPVRTKVSERCALRSFPGLRSRSYLDEVGSEEARLAQLVEHPLDVGRVVGSSPAARTMEKSKEIAIETNQYKNNPEDFVEEQDAIEESISTMHKLVFGKQTKVEIRLNALGDKTAIVRHAGKIIYSTDIPDEVAGFELFLKNPEAAIEEYIKNEGLKKTLKTMYDPMIETGEIDK